MRFAVVVATLVAAGCGIRATAAADPPSLAMFLFAAVFWGCTELVAAPPRRLLASRGFRQVVAGMFCASAVSLNGKILSMRTFNFPDAVHVNRSVARWSSSAPAWIRT